MNWKKSVLPAAIAAFAISGGERPAVAGSSGSFNYRPPPVYAPPPRPTYRPPVQTFQPRIIQPRGPQPSRIPQTTRYPGPTRPKTTTGPISTKHQRVPSVKTGPQTTVQQVGVSGVKSPVNVTPKHIDRQKLGASVSGGPAQSGTAGRTPNQAITPAVKDRIATLSAQLATDKANRSRELQQRRNKQQTEQQRKQEQQRRERESTLLATQAAGRVRTIAAPPIPPPGGSRSTQSPPPPPRVNINGGNGGNGGGRFQSDAAGVRVHSTGKDLAVVSRLSRPDPRNVDGGIGPKPTKQLTSIPEVRAEIDKLLKKVHASRPVNQNNGGGGGVPPSHAPPRTTSLAKSLPGGIAGTQLGKEFSKKANGANPPPHHKPDGGKVDFTEHNKKMLQKQAANDLIHKPLPPPSTAKEASAEANRSAREKLDTFIKDRVNHPSAENSHVSNASSKPPNQDGGSKDVKIPGGDPWSKENKGLFTGRFNTAANNQHAASAGSKPPNQGGDSKNVKIPGGDPWSDENKGFFTTRFNDAAKPQ